ncbi:MAG: hypothetical protein LBH58_12120 [Tannerellaceae bacterium]|jgi:hypothetical protein|nr:hypothetical protein [Tannerellaceae bacterium]
MKAYLKEIVISLLAVLILMSAVWVYIRSMQTEQSNVSADLYTMIPPDINALLVVNRPSVLNLMILPKQAFYKVFASEIPPVLLSFIQRSQQVQSLMLSFHRQGVVGYMQVGDRAAGRLKHFMDNIFPYYKPVKQNINGIDFYYYPDVNNRFFGYYFHNGVWVGSYSKKLLEKAASQQLDNQLSLPEEIDEMRKAFDATAPMNILFPANDLNLRVSQWGMTDWRIANKWLVADLFVSEGNFCCYGNLPYEPEVTSQMYKMMGDTLSSRIRNLYPSVNLSFQINRDEEFIYFTGCTPIPD